MTLKRYCRTEDGGRKLKLEHFFVQGILKCLFSLRPFSYERLQLNERRNDTSIVWWTVGWVFIIRNVTHTICIFIIHINAEIQINVWCKNTGNQVYGGNKGLFTTNWNIVWHFCLEWGFNNCQDTGNAVVAKLLYCRTISLGYFS